MKKHVCLGCEKRHVGCHGKDEQGRWRCPDWAREQAANEARRDAWREERRQTLERAGYKAQKTTQRIRRARSHH